MTLTKPLQVFLLYARADQEAVHRLYQRLVKDGANVWLDKKKLWPGQDWVYEIHKAIRSSDLVIVCLSRQFNKEGGYRHEELKIAIEKANSLSEGATFLIPARLDHCDMPESLQHWQRVDLFETDGYQKLLGALKGYVASTY
ncbi:MAG TPA: toll/interleukin-1 receptor domain-containing protein [Anaerolineales bacterium]|nr:toll/interleukin-1 receptor domain-containing protein [Anaerolineales bacterium]